MKNMKKALSVFLSILTVFGLCITATAANDSDLCEHATTAVTGFNPAACEFEGYTGDIVCTECGFVVSEGEYVAPYGHDFNTLPIEVIAASCSSPRVLVYKCRNCDETKHVVDPAGKLEPHDMVVVEDIEPTCDKVGYFTYYCVVCSTTLTVNEIPPIGHLDENGDGKCDRFGCGGVVETSGANDNCTCMCHEESGLKQFIFKILCFFFEILNIGKECECGAVHY